jgi:hypothetical protein
MCKTSAAWVRREQAQLAVNNVGQTLRGQVSIGLAPGTAASAITMRWRDPSLSAYQQLLVHFTFQGRDLLAEGRLGDVQDV